MTAEPIITVIGCSDARINEKQETRYRSGNRNIKSVDFLLKTTSQDYFTRATHNYLYVNLITQKHSNLLTATNDK